MPLLSEAMNTQVDWSFGAVGSWIRLKHLKLLMCYSPKPFGGRVVVFGIRPTRLADEGLGKQPPHYDS